MTVEKDNPLNIKINLIAFYALFVVFIEPKYFFDFSLYPTELWLPSGLFELFKAPLKLSPDSIIFFAYTTTGTALLSMAGAWAKFTRPVFFVLIFLMFNISHNYGYHTHTFMPLVVVAMIAAFGGQHKTFLIKLFFCSLFFSAGLSKIRNGGVDWFLTESFQNILIRSQLFYGGNHPFAEQFGINKLFASSLLFTQIAAFSAILLELCAPLSLIFKKFGILVIVGLLVMQVLSYFTLLVNFKTYLMIYIFWLDWDFLIESGKQKYLNFRNN